MQENKLYERLNRIDGLRGLAILGVIVIHSQMISNPISNQIIHNFVNMGKYGVQLFFLISGFILCYVKTEKKYDTATFFTKRFFKLAPLYYIVIIMCYLLGFNNKLEPNIQIMPLDFKNFLIHISFLHGLFPEYIRSIFSVSWSLTPEVVFYALFPFLFLQSNRALISLFFIFLVIANFQYSISTFIFGEYNDALGIWMGHSPINNMFLFIFGMLVFKFSEFFRHSKFTTYLGLAGLSLLFLTGFGALGKDVGKVASFIFSNAYFGYILLAFPFLVYSTDKITSAFFDNKVMAYIGKWSYSAFFIHYAILMLGFNLNIKYSPAIVIPAVILLTMIFSYLSYNLIEQRGIRIGNSVIKNLSLAFKNMSLAKQK